MPIVARGCIYSQRCLEGPGFWRIFPAKRDHRRSAWRSGWRPTWLPSTKPAFTLFPDPAPLKRSHHLHPPGCRQMCQGPSSFWESHHSQRPLVMPLVSALKWTSSRERRYELITIPCPRPFDRHYCVLVPRKGTHLSEHPRSRSQGVPCSMPGLFLLVEDILEATGQMAVL